MQGRRRQARSQGERDDWKEIKFPDDGSVIITRRNGAVEMYDSREDERRGRFRAMRPSNRKR